PSGALPVDQPAPRPSGDAGGADLLVLLDPEHGARRRRPHPALRPRHGDPARGPRQAGPPRRGPAHGHLPQPAPPLGGDVKRSEPHRAESSPRISGDAPYVPSGVSQLAGSMVREPAGGAAGSGRMG